MLIEVAENVIIGSTVLYGIISAIQIAIILVPILIEKVIQ